MHEAIRRKVAGVKFRYKQLKGKLRRFFLCVFRKSYVEANIFRRNGECERCGQCCKLVFKCPFLRTDREGVTKCVIYGTRMEQCERFPIDERDLEEIDRTHCGYHF